MPVDHAAAPRNSKIPDRVKLVRLCEAMQDNLATMSGSDLKELIYDLFPDEVGNATLHQEIRP